MTLSKIVLIIDSWTDLFKQLTINKKSFHFVVSSSILNCFNELDLPKMSLLAVLQLVCCTIDIESNLVEAKIKIMFIIKVIQSRCNKIPVHSFE